MAGGARVTLHVAGKTVSCTATAIFDDPETVLPALDIYLRRFPQDAVYHYVRLNADRTPNTDDLARAAQTAVLIEAVID